MVFLEDVTLCHFGVREMDWPVRESVFAGGFLTSTPAFTPTGSFRETTRRQLFSVTV